MTQLNTPKKIKIHPAAAWANEQTFSTLDIDCITTVALKILDGKCKMLPGEKAAIFEIYDVVGDKSTAIFSYNDILLIDTARKSPELSVADQIRKLRIFAESSIPKWQMKEFKARLRDGLFG